MANVSSSNSLGERVPKLRFPGFEGEWEKCKVAQIFRRIQMPVDIEAAKSYIQVGIRSHGKGLFYKEPVLGEELGNKRVFWIEPNCFIVNIVFAWECAVTKTTICENGLIASHRFPMYKPIRKIVDLDYITIYFITKYGQKILELASPGGAGRNKTLGQKEFLNSFIVIPKIKEQKKIAEFIQLINKKINVQQRLLESLKLYKRGVIEAIYNQKIRFKDKNNAVYPKWTKTTIGELFNERNEKTIGEEDLLAITINNGIQKKKNISGKDISNGDKSNYKRVLINDIAYNTMRMWQGASGVSRYCGIVSPAYTVITPKDTVLVDSNFYAYYFKLPSMVNMFEKYSQGLTSDTWNLKYQQLSCISIFLPSLEEQKKVVSFLTNFDVCIENTNDSLSRMVNIKKCLLQQMFI